MELTLLAPTALSAACSKALAFWAAAGPTAGPSTRADTAINVTSTFFISLLLEIDQRSQVWDFSLSQVTAERRMRFGVHEPTNAGLGTSKNLDANRCPAPRRDRFVASPRDCCTEGDRLRDC